MQTINAQLNTKRSERMFMRGFGASSAALFTYSIVSFSSHSLCTNNRRRSGSLRSMKSAGMNLGVPANISAENDISTRNADARSIEASSKNKARRAYRALYSHYLYVSPYWA
jgi:hypothetical protein